MKTRFPMNLMLVMMLVLSMAGSVLADAAAQLEHARDLSEGQRYDKAYEAYGKVVEQLQGEQKYQAMYEWGYAAQRSKMRDEAIDIYTQLFEDKQAPESVALRGMMQAGYLYALRDDNEKARELYARIDASAYARENPSFRAEVRLRNSYTFGREKEVQDEKFAAVMSVLDVKDGHFVTHQAALCAAGGMRQEQGRYEEAIELYQRAVDMGTHTKYGEIAANRLVECEHAAHSDPSFFIDPYVSLTGQTKASIFWVASEDTPAGRVKLYEQSITGEPAAELQATLTKMADQPYNRQKADFTDLKPFTLYHYVIASGDKTRTGVFRTHRDGPGSVRFVVLGDTQTGWQNHEKLGPMIAADNPEFVLHLGDCVERGNRWDEWKVQLFDPAKPYLKKAPLWVSRGNHDGGPYFVRLMGMEEQSFESFTFGDVRVVVLNSQDHMGSRDTRQLEFLKDVLAKDDTQWVITTQHHPMFHTGLSDRLVGQDNFRPVFEADAPDLVFNGHYHSYTRLLPIGHPGQKPLINVISGGGGGQMGFVTRTAIAEVEESGPHHYCLVEIDGSKLKLTVKGIDGSVLDTLELVKTDGKFQPEVMAKTITPEQATKTHMALQRLEKQQYKRSELSGKYDAASGMVMLDRNILKPESLPENTTLLIEPHADSAWKIEKAELLLSQPGKLAFKATPPQKDDAAAALPELKVQATLTIDGQRLVPKPYTVLIESDANDTVVRTPY